MTIGNTRVVSLNKGSKRLGYNVLVKLEFENPTGSFKDRGSVVEIAEAKRLGKRGVVCASTGNMAISLSYLARREGLLSVVVVPAKTPPAKLTKIESFGGNIVPIYGTYDDCVGIAEGRARTDNLLLCGDYELRRIGQRSVGAELSGLDLDAIIVPYGNGTLLAAIAEGLDGTDARMPAIIAARPITPNTIASACNVSSPLDGALAEAWVQKTNGCFVDVTDDEIRVAEARLRDDGLDVEFSAATTLAALEKSDLGAKTVLLILTGNNK